MASLPVFDPSVHLAYVPPSKRHTMKELGLEGQGVSEIGITEPFPLLSPEAVRALRGDIFNKPVLDNYSPFLSCHRPGAHLAPVSSILCFGQLFRQSYPHVKFVGWDPTTWLNSSGIFGRTLTPYAHAQMQLVWIFSQSCPTRYVRILFFTHN